jgi:hypothetical protein
MVSQQPTPTTTAANPGWVTFVVRRTADNSLQQVSVYFPPDVWNAFKGAGWFMDRYGLSAGVNGDIPVVPAGQLDNFKRDMAQVLPPDLMPVANEKLATTDTVAGNNNPDPADQPPLPVSDKMAESGIQWSKDPITKKWVLIDTLPLVGPKLSSWQWIVRDPHNPNDGEWKLIADPSDSNALMEGVPEAVRPWLQAALDNGGDSTIVPAGPMRTWVEFVLGQARGSSRRSPNDPAFGVGLPNFRPTAPSGGQPALTTTPGATPMPTGQGGGGTSPSGSGQPSSIPQHGPGTSDTAAIITQHIMAGTGFTPVYGDAVAGAGQYNFDGTASMIDMLMQGGAVGLAPGIENTNTPLGAAVRALVQAGIIEMPTMGQLLGDKLPYLDQQNRNAGGQGINPNSTQIKWKGPVAPNGTIPGVNALTIPGSLGGDPRANHEGGQSGTQASGAPTPPAGIQDVPKDASPYIKTAGHGTLGPNGIPTGGGQYSTENPATVAQQKVIDQYGPNSLAGRARRFNLGQTSSFEPDPYAPPINTPTSANFGDSNRMVHDQWGRSMTAREAEAAGYPYFEVNQPPAPPQSSEAPYVPSPTPLPGSGPQSTVNPGGGFSLPPAAPAYAQQAVSQPAQSQPAPQQSAPTQEHMAQYFNILSQTGSQYIAGEYLKSLGYS